MGEWSNWLLFLTGLVLLYCGAGWLVKGASSLAQRLGLTPLVIGLTVVAFGTSMPELVVSVVSSLKGKSMIAVGNVIGSNICNIALVLGMSALLNPIKSHPKAVRRDIPIMLGISAYLFFITLDSQLSRLEGATLVGGIIAYTWAGYYWARKENYELNCKVVPAVSCQDEGLPCVEALSRQIVYILVGIGGLSWGPSF